MAQSRVYLKCPHCGNVDWLYPENQRSVIMMCGKCHKDYMWQPPTNLPYAAGVSNCNGTSDLPAPRLKTSEQIKTAFDQCIALRETLGTVSFDSLGSRYPRGFTETKETIEQQLQESANVTVARLQSILYNLYTRAVIAETNMILGTEISDANIGTLIKAP